MNLRAPLLALLLATSATAGDDNLVAHGGFEKGVDGWRIDAAHAVTTRRAPGSNGARSLLLKGAGSARTVIAVPGRLRLLRVTAFVAAEAANGGRLRFELRDREGRVLNPETDLLDLTHFICRSAQLSGSVAWRHCARRFAVPPGATSAAFVLESEGGRLWLDDVAVVPDSLTRTNLLANGGFESGMTGWLATRATHALDKRTKAEGRQALRAEKRGGHVAACFRIADVSFLPRGGRLRVSARIRAASIDTAGVQLLVYSRRGTVLTWRSLGGADLTPLVSVKDAWPHVAPILRREGLRGTLDWTALALEIDVPDGAYRAKVLLNWQDAGGGLGRVWLDDVSLRWFPREAKAARVR
ncbi:MAG: hypothetical protein ACYTEZ_20165 [Planctomycetota bacterium]|jgi:hypothetical protein